MRAFDVVKEYFPDANDEYADFILWSKTGYPAFWPDKGKSPEENLRVQLAEFKEALKTVPLNKMCGFCLLEAVDNGSCENHSYRKIKELEQ